MSDPDPIQEFFNADLEEELKRTKTEILDLKMALGHERQANMLLQDRCKVYLEQLRKIRKLLKAVCRVRSQVKVINGGYDVETKV